MPGLLAVDLGLRTGLARFGADGGLIWYRSQHIASRAALRRAVHGLLETDPALTHLLLEGGGPLAEIWEKAARYRGLAFRRIDAETWRSDVFTNSDRLDRDRAKRRAERLARAVIARSGAPRPTSLRHDAAEAILIGLWGVMDAGWLREPLDSDD